MKKILLLVLGAMAASGAHAWEAKVTNILQHGTTVAVYLSPDPGPGSCSFGQPYLLTVDDTPAGKQRFALILTALSTGQAIYGYDDGCDTAIWAKSRPIIVRLGLNAP